MLIILEWKNLNFKKILMCPSYLGHYSKCLIKIHYYSEDRIGRMNECWLLLLLMCYSYAAKCIEMYTNVRGMAVMMDEWTARLERTNNMRIILFVRSTHSAINIPERCVYLIIVVINIV